VAADPATVVVVALTAIALALRFSQVHQSLLGDEVFTYQDIHGRSFGAVLTTVHTGGENSPPLFFLLAWLTSKVGDPTVWIRLPSIVLGAATVPLVYALGRQTVGRLAGLVGAAFFAIDPFTVYYGSEARPYATMTFFVALSTFALLHAVRTRQLPWWTLYVLAAAAAAYTHYTSVFVLVVQGGWSIWRCRDRLRQPLIAYAVAAILYLPGSPTCAARNWASSARCTR
jgi:mannosyltransferase